MRLLEDLRVAEAERANLQRNADEALARAKVAQAKADDAEAVCAALRRRGTAGVSIRDLPEALLMDLVPALEMKLAVLVGATSKAWRRWSDGVLETRAAAADASRRCPMCMSAYNQSNADVMFRACCARAVCINCGEDHGDRPVCCPFCREPHSGCDAEEVARLRSQVDRGNALAVRALGEFHGGIKRGRDVETTYGRSSMIELPGGCCTWRGCLGLKYSRGEAMALFEQAANLGDGSAAFTIGIAHSNEHEDRTKALRYIQMSADLGSKFGQMYAACYFITGFMVDTNYGCMPNRQHALNYLRNYDDCSIFGEQGLREAVRYLRLCYEQDEEKLAELLNPTKSAIESLLDEYDKNIRASATSRWLGL